MRSELLQRFVSRMLAAVPSMTNDAEAENYPRALPTESVSLSSAIFARNVFICRSFWSDNDRLALDVANDRGRETR
jgi:hypothetical protein